MRKTLKIILFTIIFLIIIWLILFIADYFRYRDNRKPFIILNRTHYDCVNGYINEYLGLGYKYIDYHRDGTVKKELIPFWDEKED